ncbi:MAG: glycosyltransferase family 2 protein [Lactococcus lactis]|nr:glycosyltransferase family 2 protein [Lactobacillus sp.]MDN6079638.1 glycosyltransferase family 2 protein [Lactococcus lactis]
MTELLLSFIMPTYNSSLYIEETLDSLLKSIGDYSDITEVICVDDGSSDSTIEIIERFQSLFPNLYLFKNSHGGVSTARNTALEQVKGKFLTFVDSDDLFSSNFVEYFMNLDKNFDLLFTDVKNTGGLVSYTSVSSNDKLAIFKANFGIGEYKIHPGVAGKIFRSQFVQDNQIRFNEKLSFAEDILFNFSALTIANNVLLDDKEFYYVNGTHSLMYYNEKNLTGQLEFVEEIRLLLKKYPESESKDLIERMVVLKAMTVYIDRYFGPLLLNGTYSLSEASKLLKFTIEGNGFSKSFKSSSLDYSIGHRYVVFRKLLRFKQYKLCLIYNRIMDKIKGYERFRKQ